MRTVSQGLGQELCVLKGVTKLELQILDRSHNEKGWQASDSPYQPLFYCRALYERRSFGGHFNKAGRCRACASPIAATVKPYWPIFCPELAIKASMPCSDLFF